MKVLHDEIIQEGIVPTCLPGEKECGGPKRETRVATADSAPPATATHTPLAARNIELNSTSQEFETGYSVTLPCPCAALSWALGPAWLGRAGGHWRGGAVVSLTRDAQGDSGEQPEPELARGCR